MDNKELNKKTGEINSDVPESIKKANKHIELIAKGFVGSPSFQKAIENVFDIMQSSICFKKIKHDLIIKSCFLYARKRTAPNNKLDFKIELSLILTR